MILLMMIQSIETRAAAPFEWSSLWPPNPSRGPLGEGDCAPRRSKQKKGSTPHVVAKLLI